MSRELLKEIAEVFRDRRGGISWIVDPLLDKIEAELSKPDPEPVAWVDKVNFELLADKNWSITCYVDNTSTSTKTIPLYSEPVDQSTRIAELTERLAKATLDYAESSNLLTERIDELIAQRSMQEEIIKTTYTRCRELEQQLAELQTKRKPLSDGITELWLKSQGNIYKFARAIENAHGITE